MYEWQTAHNRFDRERGATRALNAIPNVLFGGGTTDAVAVLTRPRSVAEAWGADEAADFRLRDAVAGRYNGVRTRHEQEQLALIARQEAARHAAQSAPVPPLGANSPFGDNRRAYMLRRNAVVSFSSSCVSCVCDC